MSDVTEDSMTVLPPRRRGRPRVKDNGATVCTWLPASYHDRLIKMANDQNESVSSLVKSLLLTHLEGPSRVQKYPK